MCTSALVILFLLVHASLEQSGDSPEPQDDEEPEGEVRMNYSCFSKIRLSNTKVFCTATDMSSENTRPVYFNACTSDGCTKKKENEYFTFDSMGEEINICMVWKKFKSCNTYEIIKIVLPDPPVNLFIKYNNQSEEYIFVIVTPYQGNELLVTKLLHEVAVRKETDEEWPDCEKKIGSYKMCFQDTTEMGVPKRNLEYSTKYEARVRSKPHGGFFYGVWSAWSKTARFETEPDKTEPDKTESKSGDFLPLILSPIIVTVVLIILVIITVFWKSRIKPLIWPEIPDHKTTLEKLCHKPKQAHHISFNPDYFENMPINKVDYIKAQVRTEDNLQLITTDIQLEKHEVSACSNMPSPAEGSGRSSTTANQAGQCDHLSGPMTANETHGDNALENPLNSVNVLLPSTASVADKCNPSNDSPAVMSHPGAQSLPSYSAAVKQPNNGLKGLCWEDIYIAMSAFKTPSSAAKQVPKNSL